MRIHRSAIVPMLALLGGVALGSVSCGPKEPAAPPASTAPAPAAPAKPEPPAPEPASPTPAPGPKTTQPAVKAVPATAASAATGAQAPAVARSGSPAVTIAQAPAPEAKPAAAPKPILPAQPTSPISDPGGEVAVKPTKAGLARVGASACKMCHRVQFASWSETAHAKRTPPLDCESCHGQGSEYKSMAVMKDPAKARAAGLVQPGPAFCTTCHKRGWNDGMMKKAHAHKV